MTAPPQGQSGATGRFAGRTAIVTAGGAGIGEAIALEWSRGDGRTVVGDIDQAAAQRVAATIAAEGGQALGFAMDVNQPDAIKPLIESALATFGGSIDALFNVVNITLDFPAGAISPIPAPTPQPAQAQQPAPQPTPLAAAPPQRPASADPIGDLLR